MWPKLYVLKKNPHDTYQAKNCFLPLFCELARSHTGSDNFIHVFVLEPQLSSVNFKEHISPLAQLA